MATTKSEMPPLHAAESTASALSAMGSGGVSSVSGGGANGPAGNATNATANSTSSSASATNTATVNNTISAAADSSDNQPGTPQPQPQQIGVNEQHQQAQQTATSTGGAQNLYPSHAMYSTTSTTASGNLPHMYSGSIYATSTGNGVGSGHDMQQQQQQSSYPSYLSSYEQFYQQQGQTHSAHSNSGGASGGNSAAGLDFSHAASLYSSNNSNEFKSGSSAVAIRYHPYLQTPTSNGGSGSGNLSNDGSEVGVPSAGSNQVGLPLSSNNGTVSTTTAMSPRVVSSSSPTSTSSQLHMGGVGNLGGGNPQSPACGQQLLCKKCGIMCTNDSELQEHITNVHGASPYGSSGYSSSPYIKEELSGGSSNQIQHPQQQQGVANPNELLDLDSQKMVYPPIPGSVQSIMGHGGLHNQQPPHHSMHDPIVGDPLHSMHSMQHRALPGWDQPQGMSTAAGNGSQEGLPSYMQQADITPKPNHSPYYSPKQSPYHGASVPGVTNIKHEYPLIKSEYADSQNYVDKSFDPNVATATEMCQQTQNSNAQQSMLPVSSSPAEFPSTTTGPAPEQQQPYRNFEPPTSSSVLPANSITAKAATWKSNEARRPKTYNCTACNKWFTSSGHLKRHYNTTLHKNAVKTSGQPDPATMPISAHHHPARDPNGKSSRRGNNNSSAAAAAAAAQQQKPPAPVQPPEPPRTPPDFGSTTQQPASGSGGMPFGQANGYQQQPQPYLAQVQSTTNASPQHGSSAVGAAQSQTQSETVLNGHPNGLAGPSALLTTTAAQTTLLMPSSHTRGLLNTITTITKRETSAEEDISTTTTAMDTMHRSPMDMSMMGAKEATEILQAPLDAAAETPAASHQQQETHHPMLVKQELPELEAQEYQMLDPHHHQQQQQQRPYHNSTPNSSQAQSPLTICHQQYQEQLHLQQQQMAADIFSQQQQQQLQQQAHMLQLPPPNTMEAYSILGISTPPPHSNSMQLLQPSQRITSTTATIANMDSIHMLPPQHSLLRHHQLEQESEPPAHNMLSNTTITSMPDIQRNTIITPHMPLPSIIPSYQQAPQPEAQLPLEHTMTYHTIIGNGNYGTASNSSDESAIANNNTSDVMQFTNFDPYAGASMFTTSDGQLLQFISNNGLMQPTYFSTFPTRTAAVAESYVRSYSSSSTQRSPQEADLPPISSLAHTYNQTPQESQTSLMTSADMPYSPTVSSSTAADGNNISENLTTLEKSSSLKNNMPKAAAKSNARKPKRNAGGTANNQNPAKRKRVSTGENATNTAVSTTTGNILLPSGRIKCLECDKEFTKVCYLTQHNKCFHSGEYPYRCEKCGKRFQDEEIYTTHLDRHKTVDKPHKCELCPKQFHHKTDLRRHVEGIHTGMKQHVCDICEKSFCRKDHLRKHLETHNRPRVVSRKSNANRSSIASSKSSEKKLGLAPTSSSPKQAKNTILVKNEAFADSSPAGTQVDGGESSPLDGDCGALDLYVVIKNENQSHNFNVQHHGATVNKLNEDDDEIDVADDDMALDRDDDDDEDNTNEDVDEGEYLLGGCEGDKEIIHHKIMLQRSLPHFQHTKLLQQNF